MSLNGNFTPFLLRILEAAIIGGIIVYGSVLIQNERIDGVKEDVGHLRGQYADIMTMHGNMREDIAALKAKRCPTSAPNL